MTNQEKKELDGAIFYRHLEMFEGALEDCEDAQVAFYVGRVVGMMQKTLRTWPTEEEKA